MMSDILVRMLADLARMLVAFALVLPLFLRWRKYFDLSLLDPRRWGRPERKTLVQIAQVSMIGLSISLMALPAIDALSFRAGPVIDETSPTVVVFRASPLLLLPIIALMPILEEWFFRGCILKLFRDKKGKVLALVGSAALFGVFHVLQSGAYPLAFLSPFFAGLVFGGCYFAQGLASATAAHSGYNVIVYLFWWLR